jgi:hypothetical protein
MSVESQDDAVSGREAPGAALHNVERRAFVRRVGLLSGVLALGSPLAALMPSRTWAVEFKVLSTAEAAALLAMIRTLAPHDGLDDSAYALVVGAIDGDAAASPQAHADLTAGIATLGPGFAGLTEAARVEQLQRIESGPFFQTMRLRTITTLYASPIAWAHFGFEGEAFSKGGYLLRGFNDLKWLPDVPLADSGPMPFG